MEIPTLNLYIPGGSIHTTIQAAINAAAISPRGAVWIASNYSGSDTYTNPSSVPIIDLRGSGSLSFAGAGSVTRIVYNGTQQVSGNIALSGWGSTAAVSFLTGQDSALIFTISSSGTGQTTSPTVVITFKDGAWSNDPICLAQQTGGTGAISDMSVTSLSTTTETLTWGGIPQAGSTYTFTVLNFGA